MNRAKVLLLGWASVFILAVAVFFGTGLSADAQDSQHLTITQPGGMPGLPVMTGVQRVTNGVSVTWTGPSGYYQLFQKLGLANAKWQPVGGFNLTNQAIVPANGSNIFFRVAGPSPQYVGARACMECHPNTHDNMMKTAHAGAFTNAPFVAQGGQTNSLCLSCHTVGFGLPTGFSSKLTTPHLASVQCENCHGPAAMHAANPEDFTVRPRVDIAAPVCGGCHTSKSVPAQVAASHPPFYEDWNSSAHRAVRDELKEDFVSSRGPTFYIPTCGRCHSGTVREAFLENAPLPDGHEAGAVGIACATCHDPHSKHVHTNVLTGVQSFTNTLTGYSYVITNNTLGALYTNQLIESLASLQDYHTSGDFKTNYNAQINVCAQCHNDRGASWVNSDRPPHHSPQYNMLLGTVGELATGLSPHLPATHSRIEKQCVSCHMPTSGQKSGHMFTVTSYESCAACHGSAANAEGFVSLIQGIITSMSEEVKAGLDQWATNKAPAEIRKYGTLAWEYQNAGQLSNPDGTLSGPVSAPNDPAKDEQKYIPTNIKKARFNLYLVVNDGSYGVHNGPYAITLLDTALNWIQTELNKQLE
jgi:hypothetical protein